MAHVFLSHAHADALWARRIALGLVREGIDVFWEHEAIRGRQLKDIRARIRSAPAVLVLWSQTSVDSMIVAEEARWAHQAGSLVSVCIDDIAFSPASPQTWSLRLGDWQGEITHKAWRALIEALRLRIGERRDPSAPDSGRSIS